MRVLIVGYKGRVAKRHIKAWSELGVEWIGCGSDEYLPSKLQAESPDLVDICTPIYLHANMIKECSLAQLPVICEKPLALTENEAQEIIKLPTKIGIVYQFRYNPKVRKLKKEIQKGKYGEIKMVTAHYYRWRGWEYYQKWEDNIHKAGGGVLFNVCIHYIDLLQWIFGYPIGVKGYMTTAKQGLDIEDNLLAILMFPQGTIGSLELSTHVNPPKHFELSVYGTKGHKTIQLRQNEYHKRYFEEFLMDGEYVKPIEAYKSFRIVKDIYDSCHR